MLASSTTRRFCARTFNGVPRVVTLKPGQYTPERLAAAVQRALNGMTTNDTEDSYVVTFEATGDKGRFSIGNTRCPFSLELQVNPNDQRRGVQPAARHALPARAHGLPGTPVHGAAVLSGRARCPAGGGRAAAARRVPRHPPGAPTFSTIHILLTMRSSLSPCAVVCREALYREA